ncbi:hypothetical protein [Caenimonas sp. SL110]|uniref:hypothetical protein n=1 Tax=Caenimonas sp. SL110 TaxID=1450524 RepID=UPI00128E0C17|nr:hypothetical protein [Caenimonas sp. SL110]
MRRWKFTLLGLLVSAASFNALACYTVHDSAGRVVYQGADAPVDMSRPLHQTVPQRFPGGHMVFDTTTVCTSINAAGTGTNRGLQKAVLSSPLLTDAATARRMNVPHTVVARGVAVVDGPAVAMAPAVTVIPSDQTALAIARADRQNRAPTVITEYRDAGVVDTRSMGAGPAVRR